MSRIDCRHWKISTGRHFQNGRHNTAKIKHCPISSKFDMWVDNDVPNWFRHWKISTGRHFQNSRHNTTQIQHCTISTPFHMWVDYDVPNWFLTSKNFYRSPFSKWPQQYHTNSTLSDFNDISYVGRLWCPEMIPDIEKFLPVVIFKIAVTIPHKFNIVRFQRPELIPDIEKFLPVSIFKMAATILQKFNIVRFQR
jgi:hypothetical protein